MPSCMVTTWTHCKPTLCRQHPYCPVCSTHLGKHRLAIARRAIEQQAACGRPQALKQVRSQRWQNHHLVQRLRRVPRFVFYKCLRSHDATATLGWMTVPLSTDCMQLVWVQPQARLTCLAVASPAMSDHRTPELLSSTSLRIMSCMRASSFAAAGVPRGAAGCAAPVIETT